MFNFYSPLPCQIRIVKIKEYPVQSNQAIASIVSVDWHGLRLLSELQFPQDPELTLGFMLQKAQRTFVFEGTIVAKASLGRHTSYDVAFARNTEDYLHLLRFVAWLAFPNIPDYLQKLEAYNVFLRQKKEMFRKRVDLLI